jgi:glycosyl transferase family 2
VGDPLVSVVMPVHDGAAFLRPAIDSILRQTCRDFELVVIDDGSGDGTPAILAEAARADPRVRLLRRDRRGAGLTVALGEACAAARGRYLARMDADDVAVPERLDRQVAELEAHRDLAVLGSAMRFLGRAGPLDRILRHPAGPSGLRRHLERANCIAHPTVMMRRGAYEEAGGYRRAFLHAEDYDLWLRIAERHDLANLPEPLLDYRVHERQISFAHVAEQATYALAARRSAALRRQGRPDPTAGLHSIGRQDLLRMGESAEALEQAILDGFVYRIDLMTFCGFETEALRSLAELALEPLSGGAARRRDAEIDWFRGKIDLRAGRWLPGLGRVARACLRRPAFAIHLAAALPRLVRGPEGGGGR